MINYSSAFQCGTCGEKFEDGSGLRTHMGNVHRTKKYHADGHSFECFFCKKKMTTYLEVRKHFQKYHPIKKQKCSICDIKLTCSDLSIHSCIGKEKLKCEYCSSRFDSVIALSNHLNHTHAKRKKLYKCDHCHKYFTLKIFRDQHMKIHKAKQIQCEICTKKICSKTAFKYHFQSAHLTEKSMLNIFINYFMFEGNNNFLFLSAFV